jgi:DNA-binding beta-propeller fold protein YncE
MDNNTLAVVSQSGESLNFFDLSSGKRTAQLSNLTKEPHELQYDPRTTLLYLTHTYEHGMYGNHGEYSHELSIIDCNDQMRVVDTIDVSPYKGPHGMALDRQHDILYVSVEGGMSDSTADGGIIGIDLKTRKIVKAIGSGHYSHWFVMTPDGKKAYTSNKEAGFISILDLEKEKMIGKIDIDGGCEQPGISNDGRWAYFPTPQLSFKGVTNPSIKVIDTRTDEIVKSIPMDLGALAVHIDSKDRLLVGQYRLEFDEKAKRPVPLSGKLLTLSREDRGYSELGAVDVELMPLTVFSSPDGSRAFVSNIFSGTVTIVDMDVMKVERTLDVDTVHRQDKAMHQGAHGLALVP